MFEVFYAFDAAPFRLTPDHRLCYRHRSYEKARTYMKFALDHAEGFVMITGIPGVGKTTLINDLLANLAAEPVVIAKLQSTIFHDDDLLRMVAFSFGLEPESMDKATLVRAIEKYLIEQRETQGRRALLAVDEAQDLTSPALVELRMLSNLQLNCEPLLQVFLLGQNRLVDLIRRPGMEQVHQRFIATYELEPLGADEIQDYVQTRMGKVGWKGDPTIDGDVFTVMHAISRGIPRLINTLCTRLLQRGSREQKHELHELDLWAAIDELKQEKLLPAEDLALLEVFRTPMTRPEDFAPKGSQFEPESTLSPATTGLSVPGLGQPQAAVPQHRYEANGYPGNRPPQEVEQRMVESNSRAPSNNLPFGAVPARPSPPGPRRIVASSSAHPHRYSRSRPLSNHDRDNHNRAQRTDTNLKRLTRWSLSLGLFLVVFLTVGYWGLGPLAPDTLETGADQTAAGTSQLSQDRDELTAAAGPPTTRVGSSPEPDLGSPVQPHQKTPVAPLPVRSTPSSTTPQTPGVGRKAVSTAAPSSDPAGVGPTEVATDADSKQREIRELLLLAEQASQTGNDAYEIYSSVLKLDPNNAEALGGLARTAAIRLAQSAQTSKAQGQLQESLARVEEGSQTIPNTSEMATFRNDIRAESAQQARQAMANAQTPSDQQPPSSPPYSSPYSLGSEQTARRVTELALRAERQFAQNRLTIPAGNNALESYREILRLLPNHQGARDGIARIKAQYTRWAENAIQRANLENAQIYYRRAAAIDPQDSTIRETLRKLEEAEQFSERALGEQE
jgi:type II secretory pathway predicted ATPase ExeA/tetratricopeptide (TPR) repeat protein